MSTNFLAMVAITTPWETQSSKQNINTQGLTPPPDLVSRVGTDPGYAGLTKSYDFVDEHPVLGLMGGPPDDSRKAYGRYVEAGIAQTDEEFGDLLRTSRWGIGDELFKERVRDLHAGRAQEVRRPEDVSFRRVTPTASAAAVLSAVAGVFQIEEAVLRRRCYGCRARAVAALLLGRHAGMNQRDVGVLLGMGTGSAVCRQLRGLRERMISDRSLGEMVSRAETAMQQTAPQSREA